MGIDEILKELKEFIEMYGSRHDREDFSIISNFIKKQKAELEKKDKVIDEMTVEIAWLNYEVIGAWCKRDNCRNFKENDYKKCDHNNEKCIKEYFYKRSE